MSKNLLKVSIIEPIGGHGGNEFYDFGLCEAICEQGIEVTLYTCDETTLDKKFPFKTNVKKYYKGIYGKYPKSIRGIRYIKGTLKSLVDAKLLGSKIAHFHIYGFSSLEYLNIFLFKKAGFKIVATVHDIENLSDMDVKNSKKVYEKFFNIIDSVVVHTNFTKERLNNIIPRYKKIHIVLSADLDFVFNREIERMEARKELKLDNISKDDLLILFFGQIKEVKGLDVLIKAFSYLTVDKLIPNIYLLIGGKVWKTSFDKYEQLIKELGISEDKILRHIRYIENEKVPLYFKASDIVVLPYKKIFNSSVLLRSMDYGSTVIASDLAAFKELIQDRHNGLLFANASSEDLALKLEELIVNEELRGRLKTNAKKTVKERYSWEKTGKVMKEIYSNL